MTVSGEFIDIQIFINYIFFAIIRKYFETDNTDTCLV